jgi:hypothetical protein
MKSMRPVLFVLVLAACSGGSPDPNIMEVYMQPEAYYPEDGTSGQDDLAPCTPSCDSKQCGSDGCGGVCGTCPEGTHCDPSNACSPGACTPGQIRCDGNGVSVCVTAGEPKWSPATPCPEGTVCKDGECNEPVQVCTPGQSQCVGDAVRVCSQDGTAWGSAVPCPQGQTCAQGSCVPKEDKTCSDVLTCMLKSTCGLPDAGCFTDCFAGVSQSVTQAAMAVYSCMFTACGKWGPGEACFQNQSITGCASSVNTCKGGGTCTPACAGKQCGDDGCGGSCGTCPPGSGCVAGTCACQPACSGKTCGPDGCGGSCGSCQAGQTCSGGSCAGGDSCNGVPYEGCCLNGVLYYCQQGKLLTESCQNNPQCGWNHEHHYYDCGTPGNPDPSGKFPKDCGGSCQPKCSGKVCGSNGCGGSCGSCPAGYQCTDAGTCLQQSTGSNCGAIVNCLLGCGWAQSCYWDCYNGGSDDAKQIFNSLSGCVVDACGWNMSTDCIMKAIEDECSQAYKTCMADT